MSLVAKNISSNDFKKICYLGCGNTGKVYLVRHCKDNKKQLYAMKVFTKESMLKNNRIKRVLTEREILITSQHPFIVSLHWCWHAKNEIYFVLDYCSGGDFYNILQKMPNKCLPESTVKFYSAEILLALEYLHLLGYIYRDLKPENILLHKSGHIKLADFDLSKSTGTPTKTEIIKEILGKHIGVSVTPDCITNSFVGTPCYIAPEIINKNGNHTFAVDWWSFGILLYEMLYGDLPFQGASREDTFKAITTEKLKLPNRPNVSNNARKLIKSLLTTDVNKRLGTEHGASDIKRHPFFDGINWGLLRNTTPPLIPSEQRGSNERSDEPTAEFEMKHSGHSHGDSVVPEGLFKDFHQVN